MNLCDILMARIMANWTIVERRQRLLPKRMKLLIAGNLQKQNNNAMIYTI